MPDSVYVCCACGKTSDDKYGEKNASPGWDESCMLNCVRALRSHLVFNANGNGRVTKIEDGGVVEALEPVNMKPDFSPPKRFELKRRTDEL
jgi:hypothetical protein